MHRGEKPAPRARHCIAHENKWNGHSPQPTRAAALQFLPLARLSAQPNDAIAAFCSDESQVPRRSELPRWRPSVPRQKRSGSKLERCSCCSAH